MSRGPRPEEVEAALLALAAARGPAKTFCPSEAARGLAADWRPLMPRVRAAAARLAGAGRLAVTRGGLPADPCDPRGPIRLGLPPPR